MSENDNVASIEHLLRDTVRDVIDRSAYGDWRTIATAEAVPLSYGFPDPALFPAEELIESVEGVIREKGDDALQYGGGEYSDRLAEFVAQREREKGIEEEVLLTNGATHAIDSVCRAFLDPGDHILVEAPTFMGALGVFWNYGVDITGIPLDEAGMDVDALATELETRRETDRELPKLLYTIPDFHNPTGTTLSRDRRERLLELAAEYDFAILEDGAYTDLWYGGEAPPPLASLDDSGRVIRVGTFSKTVAPGVRLGWLTAPDRIRTATRTVAPGGTNTFTRSVVGWYCDQGHFERVLPTLRDAYADRRDRMLDSLAAQMPEGVTWTEPDGGFFLWVELPAEIDTDAMLEPAADTGVTYLPGSLFYPGDRGTNALRLSFAPVDSEQLDSGIRALADTIEESM